jgi:hypothetical protein
VIALSQSLRDAFANRGQASKSELAHIFVATNIEVKDGFKVLDDNVEPTLGKEIVKFNIACKDGKKMSSHHRNHREGGSSQCAHIVPYFTVFTLT